MFLDTTEKCIEVLNLRNSCMLLYRVHARCSLIYSKRNNLISLSYTEAFVKGKKYLPSSYLVEKSYSNVIFKTIYFQGEEKKIKQ